MSEENKAVCRRVFEEALNQGRREVIDEVFASDYVDHDPSNPDQQPGPQGVHDFVNAILSGFPDTQISIEDEIAEGDRVATRFTLRGTHKGEFMDIPSTDKRIAVTGTWTCQLSGGKIAESWLNMDSLGLLQQIGAIPS